MIKKQLNFILMLAYSLSSSILNAQEMRIQPFPYPIEDTSQTPQKTKKQAFIEKIKANPKLTALISAAIIVTIAGAGYGGVKAYGYYGKKKREEETKLELLNKYLKLASETGNTGGLEQKMIGLKNKGKNEPIKPDNIMIPYGTGAIIRVAPELTPDQWLKAIKDFKAAEEKKSKSKS